MSLRTPPDQDIVLVGATGDLAARKLLPALYNLELEGLLPTSGDLIGVAPMAWDDARFRAHAEQAIRSYSRTGLDRRGFARLAKRLRFVAIQGDDNLLPLALVAQRPLRLVYLAVETTDSDCLGNEPVYDGERLVGLTTSGGYGHAVERSLAFAYVEPALAAPGTPLEVLMFQEKRRALVLDDAAWDPANQRLRA